MCKSLTPILLLSVIMGSVLAGCSEPPDQAKEATEMAMNDAKAAGAEDYAPESFSGAQSLYDQAMAEESAQNKKLALFRRYGKAEELMNQAKADFERAKEDAAAGKARARTEAEQTITEARAALDAAEAALAKAPAGKDTRADIEAMKSDLETSRQALTEAEASMSQENYLAAKSMAESVRAKAAEIESEVQAAIDKVRAKRGG